MAVFPHTHLFLGNPRAVVISGPHIQTVNAQTGEILYSTANSHNVHQAAVLKGGPVRCADVDKAYQHVVTSGEDKFLRVWQLDGLQLLSERELPKKPTRIRFTWDGQTILVSDKFGDIFSYPLHPTTKEDTTAPADAEGTSKRSQIVSHENPSDGTLILGHTSLLTSFLLTADEKYVISADRDEHIRVSWYPQGYVIERYCLGHTKFVSSVHIPKFAPSVLISGGGDPMLKVWDWMSGQLLCDIPVKAAVEPFLAVGAPKWVDVNQEETKKTGRRGRRRGKGKGKLNGEEQGEDESDPTAAVQGIHAVDEDVKMLDGLGADEVISAAAGTVETNANEESLVLVIHHISSVDVPGQGRYLIFNAVGATALFFCTFPSSFDSSEIAAVHSLQLNKPVLDFTIDARGRVWALLDGERDVQEGHGSHPLVRLLSWSDGKLVESRDSSSPLIEALNSTCKIPAPPESLTALELYAVLASMPKRVDAEHDPFDGVGANDEAGSRGDTPQAEQTLGKRKAKGPTQREQARMRKKQAVLAKLQAQAQTRDSSASVPSEDVPETKKAKEA